MSTTVLEVDGNNNNNNAATMPDLEAGRSQIAQLVSPDASQSSEQLARALWVLSYAIMFVGVSAGLHRPAASTGSVFTSHEAAYYGIVAIVLAAVPVEMATAFWLPRSGGRRRFHAFAEGLQRVAVLLLLLVSAMGGIQLTLKI